MLGNMKLIISRVEHAGYLTREIMVDRGRWLGNPANFKYSEQRTHLEVEQGLTVHNVF